MVPVMANPPARPSGRGVATHGAPILDGNVEAQIKDTSPSWRSILSSGEIAEAYE